MDNHGRRLNYLRLAVTDRCNLRCRYCMPAEGITSGRRDEVLTWEELRRLCRIFVELGIEKIRITGGEPFVRKGLLPFLLELSQLPGCPEIDITTNGTLLADHLDALKRIGVSRLNISLDTLNADTFYTIARRRDFEKILQAINKADTLGFKIKINVVVMAGINDHEISDFISLTRDRKWTVRFIEPMPFDGVGGRYKSLLSGDDILTRLMRQFYIVPVSNGKSAVATLFQVPGFQGRIGIIYGYSRRFCGACSRLRLSTRGELLTCLYGSPVLDMGALLRAGKSDGSVKRAISGAVGKRLSDGFEAERAFNKTTFHSMATIGG
ncbi:MAG: GTP 3',8-cyclase MoaA [Fidelibacterota bacterium]|nr:MAG: GTP 3',8-cyclase MoaA [Candidatus Neomarinimicrobiota bacterium]